MSERFGRVFGKTKPVIAMAHFDTLPRPTIFEEEAGLDGRPRTARGDLEAEKHALPDMAVLANTGVTHDTVRSVLDIADGCIVGSSLKVDGDTWSPVNSERAADFMNEVRKAQGEAR